MWKYSHIENLSDKLGNYRYQFEETIYNEDIPETKTLHGLITKSDDQDLTLLSGNVIQKYRIIQEYFHSLRKIENLNSRNIIPQVKYYSTINVKEGFFWISTNSFIFLVSSGKKKILKNTLEKALYNDSSLILNFRINLEELERMFPRLWHSAIKKRDQQSTNGITINTGMYYGEDILSDIEQGTIISNKKKSTIGLDVPFGRKRVRVRVSKDGMIQFPGGFANQAKDIMEFIDRVIMPLCE